MKHEMKHRTIREQRGVESEEEVRLIEQICGSSNAACYWKDEQTVQSGGAHGIRYGREYGQ